MSKFSVTPFTTPIMVTRPALPPLEQFCQGLQGIWDRAWLTNNGQLAQGFRDMLAAKIRTENLCLFANGTLALQIALQGLGITGDVITTPYTFVATTHALFWNNIRPIFADIESTYYTLDPASVERAITPNTSAILAVHVYGNPCDLDALARIATKHGLALIYDAAHAFGVEVDERPIAHFGDVSMFSFHATKLFHTVEGGMLTFQEDRLLRIFEYLRNFGFESETEVVMPGTNAKMNELQALMGMLLLDRLDAMISTRRCIAQRYRDRLRGVPGLYVPAPPREHVKYNYAYMPIEIDEEQFGMARDELYDRLRSYNVYTRRYFYPLVPDFSCYRGMANPADLPVASRVASRILTLPIYDELALSDVDRICDIICYIQAEARTTLLARGRATHERRIPQHLD